MNKAWFKLSIKSIKWLIAYFMSIFIFGLFLTIIAICYEAIDIGIRITITSVAVVGGIGTSLIGSSMYYLRKVYKASINLEMTSPINEGDNIRQLGIFIYYLLRPIFAVGFSLLLHITLKLNVTFITVQDAILGSGFIYLSMFLSFFGGFATGDLIAYFELKSQDFVTKPFQ